MQAEPFPALPSIGYDVLYGYDVFVVCIANGTSFRVPRDRK